MAEDWKQGRVCLECGKRHNGPCPERVERMVGLKRVGGSALLPGVRPVVAAAVVPPLAVLDVAVIADDGVSRKAPAGVCPYCDRDRAFQAEAQRRARERRKVEGDE